MEHLQPLEKNDLPKALSLRKLIGPSFILLGLGLGSGELILWPYLSSNFGLGIIWAAVLGITFQFFLNMEIVRYTIICGESIFVGFARKFGRFSPYWFIFSTLIPWMWPGIIASSATVLMATFGYSYSPKLAIILLILIGLIFSIGSVVYNTQEKLQKFIILVGVPFVFLITTLFVDFPDIQKLGLGLIGRGDNFWFLPAGIPIAIFLGALAYAGAGGNLNLAQSYYVKEKGYGMGKFAGRITSLLRGKKEEIKLEGTTFECNEDNLNKFKLWWKRINIEHAIVFWFTGAVTMIILSLLAYTTVYGHPDVSTGIKFVVLEGSVIAEKTLPIVGKLFLAMAGIMLFGTQFSVFGSTSRIMAENLIIASPKKFRIENMSKYFFFFLWLQIASGVIILSIGFTEPLSLIILSAVLNAFTMFVYSILILILNNSKLDVKLRPSIIRIFAIVVAIIFYGGFSIFIILQNLFK